MARDIAFYLREAAECHIAEVEIWVDAEYETPGVKVGDMVCPDCNCKKGTEHDEFCLLGEIFEILRDGVGLII